MKYYVTFEKKVVCHLAAVSNPLAAIQKSQKILVGRTYFKKSEMWRGSSSFSHDRKKNLIPCNNLASRSLEMKFTLNSIPPENPIGPHRQRGSKK